MHEQRRVPGVKEHPLRAKARLLGLLQQNQGRVRLALLPELGQEGQGEALLPVRPGQDHPEKPEDPGSRGGVSGLLGQRGYLEAQLPRGVALDEDALQDEVAAVQSTRGLAELQGELKEEDQGLVEGAVEGVVDSLAGKQLHRASLVTGCSPVGKQLVAHCSGKRKQRVSLE